MLALMAPKLFQIHYEASLLPLFMTALSIFFLISNTLDSTYNLMGNFKETLIESFFSVQGQDGPHHCFNRFFFSLCRYFLKGHGRVIFWCSWIHPD